MDPFLLSPGRRLRRPNWEEGPLVTRHLRQLQLKNDALILLDKHEKSDLQTQRRERNKVACKSSKRFQEVPRKKNMACDRREVKLVWLELGKIAVPELVVPASDFSRLRLVSPAQAGCQSIHTFLSPRISYL